MAQIHVHGKAYTLVPLDELTLDEAVVVWDYSGLSLDQIPDLDGFHPGVIAALIHVSVARGEPGEKPAAIRKVVGAIPVVSLESVFADISEDAEEDPTPTATAGPSSDGGEPSSPAGEPLPEPSGANGSGGPGSATGATSGRLTSAA